MLAKFRKTIALLLGLFICFLFVSCTAEPEITGEDNYTADYENNDMLTEARDYEIAAQALPFTGEPVPRSELFWQEARDQEWESDIRHFAVKALRMHPLLIDSAELDSFLNSFNRVYGIARERPGVLIEGYAAGAYNILLQRALTRNGILADDLDEGRYAFREFFIHKVNELILDIPSLSDYEIIFGLAAIAVLLDDAHTRMGLPMGDIFPVEFLSLYDGIYFIGVPKEIEHALYGELIAIYGIEINEIIERLARIIPHENKYYLRNKITQPAFEDPIGLRHYVVRPFLKEFIILNYLSVVDDSGIADFTVRGTTGEIFNIQLQAINREAGIDESAFVRHEFSTLMHDNPEEVFWHEYFPDESLIYIRIRSFIQRYSNIFHPARDRLMAQLLDFSAEKKIESLVIDLRQNPGGDIEWPDASAFIILSEIANSLYVITDAGTFSKGVINTSNIMRHMENATVIGEPSGQIDNMFAGYAGLLPKSRMRYNTSHRMWVGSNSEDIAIRPDIFIPLTIEDVINNRDPVLEAIKAR